MNYFSNDWLHPDVAMNFSVRDHYVNVNWEVVDGKPKPKPMPGSAVREAAQTMKISPDEDEDQGTSTHPKP